MNEQVNYDIRGPWVEFRVFVDGNQVASACGPRERAFEEAIRYAFSYCEEGKVTIQETRAREPNTKGA